MKLDDARRCRNKEGCLRPAVCFGQAPKPWLEKFASAPPRRSRPAEDGSQAVAWQPGTREASNISPKHSLASFPRGGLSPDHTPLVHARYRFFLPDFSRYWGVCVFRRQTSFVGGSSGQALAGRQNLGFPRADILKFSSPKPKGAISSLLAPGKLISATIGVFFSTCQSALLVGLSMRCGTWAATPIDVSISPRERMTREVL